jgi:hypothetical protein
MVQVLRMCTDCGEEGHCAYECALARELEAALVAEEDSDELYGLEAVE